MNEKQLKAIIKSYICNTTTFNEKYHFPIDEVVEIVNDYLKSSKPTEYILCAAIHFKDGLKHEHQPKNIESGHVICGRRHCNCFQTHYILSDNRPEHIQGFITNTNRFVDRKEAYKIAFEANQIIGPNKGYSENSIGLTSEDLYREE